MVERTTRASLWKRLLWRRVVVLTALAVLFFSSLTFLWDETGLSRPRLIEWLAKLHWYGVALLGMLVLVYVIGEAAYKAIEDAENKREAVEAKIAVLTRMPDIKGDILAVFWEFYRDLYRGPLIEHSRYYVKLRLVNHHDVPCTIDRYSITVEDYFDEKVATGEGVPSAIGKLYHPTCGYSDEGTEHVEEKDLSISTWTKTRPIEITAQSPLERGRKQEGWLTFDVWNFIPYPMNATDIAPEAHVAPWQQGVLIRLVDSFGNIHEIGNVLASVAPVRYETTKPLS